MKIVHLIDYFQPKVGYQETYLAREHQKMGHQTLVVTSNSYYPFPNYDEVYANLLGKRNLKAGIAEDEGIMTLRLPGFRLPGTPLVFLRGLRRNLQDLSPDLVFCHGVFSLTSFLVAFYKKENRYRLIYDSHASFFNTNFENSLPKRIYRSLFLKFAAGQIKEFGDDFIAIGESEKKFLSGNLGINKDRINIIPLGVDVDLFKFNKTKRIAMRNRLGFCQEDKVIVFAGKINKGKDVHILVRAVRSLKDPSTKILIIGGGNPIIIRKLKLLLSPTQLVIKSFVPNHDLNDYFSAADIGVWPGDPSQGMIEAMGCSLPLVIPKWYGTDYLNSNSGVMKFKRGDTAGLSDIIRNLSYNNKLRFRLGRLARHYTEENLSWKTIARHTLDLIK